MIARHSSDTATCLAIPASASRLLSGNRRRDLFLLMAACRDASAIMARHTDRHTARNGLRRLRAALRDRETSDALARPFLDLHDRHGLRLDMADLLVVTLLRDLEDPVVETWNGLIRYCHGSGGAVAVMMYPVLGAGADTLLPFAIDFGIACRLIDIARNVRADAEAGRIYLPAALFPRPLAPQQLCAATPQTISVAHDAACKLLKRAMVHFRSAESALPSLSARSQAALLLALRRNEALADRMAGQSPEIWWRSPASSSTIGRTWQDGKTLTGLAVDRCLHGTLSKPPQHVAALHRPLRGLPGVPRS